MIRIRTSIGSRYIRMTVVFYLDTDCLGSSVVGCLSWRTAESDYKSPQKNAQIGDVDLCAVTRIYEKLL